MLMLSMPCQRRQPAEEPCARSAVLGKRGGRQGGRAAPGVRAFRHFLMASNL